MPFPPQIAYPEAIDSDYTLFLVHNTTESKLAADNPPWSMEIDLYPVSPDSPDIWADNGFGNIDGELFYYDAVERNADGRVVKLKGCARQMGGEDTKLNRRGTWVRSYVVAEHHNQLADAVMKTQDFLGYDFDPRQKTLDWRIRNLQALDIIFDDYSCPDVNFTFTLVESSPVTGYLAEYLVEVSPPGSVSSFRLDFGDGDFTTSELSGQHRYAVNARIDPVVSVSNDKCQIVQTPIERANPAEPQPEIEQVFDIPIPEVPEFPDFSVVPCEVPEPEINLPPLVVPCISIEGQIGPIPSVITVDPPINIVSQIVVISDPFVSIISVVGDPWPSIVILDPPVPPTIVIDPPIPPTIVIVPPQSNITIDLDISDMPRLEVDWGTPPEMEVALTMARAVRSPERFAVDPDLVNQFGEEFADLFDVSGTIKATYDTVGIPSEITVIVPDDMNVRLDASDLDQKSIRIDSSGVKIPDIKIHGPDSPLPDSIRFEGHNLPDEIPVVYRGGPIPIDASQIPVSIKIVQDKEIPDRIVVEVPTPIPDRIVVESNIPDRIILEGPISIPLSLPDNFFLPVRFPDKMPEMELVYRGAPIEVKISMDKVIDKAADGSNCVMIVPCNR